MKKLLESLKTNLKISALTGILSIGSVQAEPIINITNSAGKRVSADCGDLIIAPNKKGKEDLYMTCDFTEQLNPDGKNICSHTDKMPKSYNSPMSRSELYRSMQARIDATIHFGRAHGDCIAYAANLDGKSKSKTYKERGLNPDDARSKALSDVNKLYGKGWQNKKSCTLKKALSACKSEMGLD